MVKSRSWIDKKTASTYHLVHRSQRDPLISDENSSKMVLLPVGNGSNILEENLASEFKAGNEILEDGTDYGIFFEKQDNYDYIQHLKPIGEDPSAVFIQATANSALFGSKSEMPVGLLNQPKIGGFQPDLDENVREIYEALDDDAYVEYLDDGFFEQFDAEEVDDAYLPTINEDEELELEPWMTEFRKFKKNNKCDSDDGDSGFSMSSSMMYRNEQLTLLDDQFEKILKDYSDNEIGELDGEDDEVKGDIDLNDNNTDINQLNYMFDEFLKTSKVIGSKPRLVTRRAEENLDAIRDLLRDEAKSIVEKFGREEIKNYNTTVFYPEQRIRREWDVESVLSMNSNVYNRPSLIKEISKGAPKIKIKRGFPVVDQPSEPQTLVKPTITVRSRDESKQEKIERKQEVKELKRERRQIKKNHRLMFKDEKHRQSKIEQNHKFQSQAVSL